MIVDDVAVEITDLKRRQVVSEHRIADIEGEVKDIRKLTEAVLVTSEKVDNLKSDVSELKCDVKAITARPGQRWEKLVSAALGAFATAIIVAVMTLILK
jgi:predicted  nucleic acid-binding Zn-ribbon protein